MNGGRDPSDTIFTYRRRKDGEMREAHTAIGVFHSEVECLGGISASVAPAEDEPGNHKAKNEEESNGSTNDGADTDLVG